MRACSRWLSFLLVLCLALPMTGSAGAEESSLAGTTWVATQYTGGANTITVSNPAAALESGAVVEIQFMEDNTYQWHVIHADNTFSFSGEWTQKGSDVSLEMADTGITYDLKADGGNLTYSIEDTTSVHFQPANSDTLTAIEAIEAAQEENRVPPVAASNVNFSNTRWHATGFNLELIKLFTPQNKMETLNKILGFATFVPDKKYLGTALCGVYADISFSSNGSYRAVFQASLFGSSLIDEAWSGKWQSSGSSVFLDDIGIPFTCSGGVLNLSLLGIGLYMEQ